MAHELDKKGVRAAPYHAGLDPSEKNSTHEMWRDEHLLVIVATVIDETAQAHVTLERALTEWICAV